MYSLILFDIESLATRAADVSRRVHIFFLVFAVEDAEAVTSRTKHNLRFPTINRRDATTL